MDHIEKQYKEAILSKLQEQYFTIGVEVLEGGKLPSKTHSSDAGFDLFAADDIVIYPGQVQRHPLNIKLQLPANTWASVESKSSLGAKGLLIYAGVIDEGYRGIIHVVMSNIHIIDRIDEQGYPLMRTDPIIIKKGEKVAQLVMSPHSPAYTVKQLEKVDTNTTRGEGGFGSTGKV